uniref:Uncharacterized protein n=1 Tax=Rhizophora mucronata TaxID=61149 RepID=A0A2P2N9A2_RHIMU
MYNSRGSNHLYC